jgi:ARG/rhodanese/phosphatase superfamily protein
MQVYALAAVSLATFSIAFGASRTAVADPAPVITGPHVHENMAVYFVHGDSAPGPVPLTLKEALDKGSVRVVETGTVNELKVENIGGEDVFIQAGDIVKGGKQDRVLSLSFVLPAKSGEVPLAAFCVEHGRWSARGGEDVKQFASADEAMPSREARMVMAKRSPEAPVAPSTGGERAGYAASGATDTYARQREVWDSVAKTQGLLTASLGAPVAAQASASSLQLSLENEKLQKARTSYVEALQAAGDSGEDIVGYVLAINGRIVSADVYPSNGLFRKMWGKQLAAGVTEAISVASAAAAPAPNTDAAATFLKTAAAPKPREEVINNFSSQAVSEADAALYVEAKRGDGSWVHRNYLAK